MLFIVAVALAVVIQSCVRKDGVWYNFVNNSWAGIVNNLLTLVSLIVALIRYGAKQKQLN